MIFYLLGSLILLHAGYSSWEIHRAISTRLIEYSLPTDMYLEVVVGVILLISGAIKSVANRPFLNKQGVIVEPSAPFLKPIETREATGEFEKIGITPFDELETRVAFLDVRKKRAEYEAYIKSKDNGNDE